MKILLIASLMVMVSAPVMAKWGFSHKKIERIKENKVAPIVEVKTEPQILVVKPLPNTKPMLVKQTDFRASEDATMRLPASASAIQEKAEFIQLKRAAP